MGKRIYAKLGKAVIHSSQLSLFLNCPFSKTLSEKTESDPSESMKRGLIIERLVFGDHDGQLESLTKRRHADTMAKFQAIADRLKPYFTDGEAFYKIEARRPDCFLQGEVDFQKNNGVMQDLKIYASHEYWETKKSKEDFIQAVFYNYIRTLNNLPIVDFEYVVYADDTSLIKKYRIKATAIESVLEWIADIVSQITDNLFDVLNTPEPSEDKCLRQTFGVCSYFSICNVAHEFFKNLEKEIGVLA